MKQAENQTGRETDVSTTTRRRLTHCRAIVVFLAVLAASGCIRPLKGTQTITLPSAEGGNAGRTKLTYDCACFASQLATVPEAAEILTEEARKVTAARSTNGQIPHDEADIFLSLSPLNRIALERAVVAYSCHRKGYQFYEDCPD